MKNSLRFKASYNHIEFLFLTSSHLD